VRRGRGALSLRVRLLLALAYVLLLAIVALEVPLALSLRDRVDAEVKSQARAQADVVAATVSGRLDDRAGLTQIVRTAGGTVRGRVVVVNRGGALLADSAGTDRLDSPYGDRPEIASALNGRPVQEQRRSDTLDEQILATAVPVVENGERVGAVRVTQSVDDIAAATRRSTLGLAAIGLLVLVLGLAAGILIARQIAGPLRRLDDAAAQVAAGDLTARARVEGSAEQRSLARTFNDMTARLERLVAGQREFVADASHQLRTPLSGLRLRLEEARAATRDPDVHEEIDAGLAELDRLAAILSELLVLSQAGEVDAPPEEVDLDEAVARAAARWDGSERGRVEAMEGAAGEPAFCPPADLDRVLDALIENGLRYGGGEVTLIAAPGTIEVRDHGPGLAGDELEAVFERFHRGRAGRAGPPGTGLGLPIARELARRWGGDVELANRPEGGAVARIAVPAPLFPRA
jgi:signal transduction histidine kinase